MQFVFSRAFARSILLASFIVVLVARMAHASAGPAGAPASAVPDYVPLPIIVTNCEENEALECGTLTGARLFAEATTLDAMLFKPRFVGVWARNDAAAAVAPGSRA